MLKKFLEDQGLIESTKKDPKSLEPTPSQSTGVQSFHIPVSATSNTAIDEELAKKILSQNDIHDGYSFVEFYTSNRNSVDINSGLTTLKDMTGITPDTLKRQGLETIQKLELFATEAVGTLTDELNSKVLEANERRAQLSADISSLEQQILQLKEEMTSIDIANYTNAIQDKANKIRSTVSYLKSDISSFVNKF